jgi:hypothetical protein
LWQVPDGFTGKVAVRVKADLGALEQKPAAEVWHDVK